MPKSRDRIHVANSQNHSDPNSKAAPRPRWVVGLAVLVAIGLGLLTRSQLVTQPWIREHAGDAIWALMVFFGFAFVWNRARTWTLAALSLGFCFLIEVSQLWDQPILNAIRENRFGALVLGRGFLWIDFVRYAAGVLIGALLDIVWHTVRFIPKSPFVPSLK